ncbi:hypothetical protein KIL84_016745 [Mauremys mutica]|uniref:Uncharacterized protein n=1 Tax=Mauremys mutica TaxID=74926 RepID=A0A9D4AXZ9_9SAUR|nr:hypothetical protein KIL84_016745 [Mauremys mutica]
MSHLEAFAFSSRKPLYNNSGQNIQGLLAKKNKIQIKVLDRPWPRLIPGVTTLKLTVTLVRNTAPLFKKPIQHKVQQPTLYHVHLALQLELRRLLATPYGADCAAPHVDV